MMKMLTNYNWTRRGSEEYRHEMMQYDVMDITFRNFDKRCKVISSLRRLRFRGWILLSPTLARQPHAFAFVIAVDASPLVPGIFSCTQSALSTCMYVCSRQSASPFSPSARRPPR
jgi:hypothetical protein